jgi:hypothetical protein
MSGSLSQEFMHRARMFRNAAIGLADYVGPELNWPKFGMITQAIELALKAFVLQSGKPIDPRPHNHDLAGWYRLAVKCGLQDDPSIAECIEALNEMHSIAETRYPQQRATPLPSPVNIADTAVDYLLDVITRVTNPN